MMEQNKTKMESPIPNSSSNATDDNKESKKSIFSQLISKKLIFILISLLVLGFIILETSKKVISLNKKPEKLVTIIKKQIPIPSYKTVCSIYVFARSKEREDFVRLDLKISFFGVNGIDCFHNNLVPYKDIIYRFLKNQKPNRNSLREWSSIVQNSLLKYIKKNYNICGIKSIELEQLQRL